LKVEGQHHTPIWCLKSLAESSAKRLDLQTETNLL
jgi:hypothetical protein